jgi:hypothetical protein
VKEVFYSHIENTSITASFHEEVRFGLITFLIKVRSHVYIC